MTAADRVLVLMYHRVGEVRTAAEGRYCIAPQRFAAQMRLLADKGYQAVAIDALVAWLAGGPALAQGAFVLTFDDGFQGVLTHALPVLEELGWPLTVFLVTDRLGGVDAWTRNGNPAGTTHPLMTTDEVLAMRQRGCSFHSHTRTHASLPMLDDAALADQLAGSRATLADLLGHDVDYLAYPYGHLDERVEAAARAAGYRAAFSVQPGFNRQDVNPFRVRRLDVFGTDSPATLLRKMHLGSNDGSLGHTLRYYAGQATGRLTGRAA
jgi:peptidoglycan/xylan/chitin deacetylase (PgdA/CDA1 family)